MTRNRLLLVIFGILLLGGVFTAGIVWSSLENVEQRRSYKAALDQAARLSAKNGQLTAEITVLREKIVGFERQMQVNQIAYENMTGQLSDSANYINELREDVDFYRSIISPEDNKAGVRAHALNLRPAASGGYQYELTVVQALKHDQSVIGEGVVIFHGRINDQSATIRLDNIGTPLDSLSFRYFQVLSGNFSLPTGFKPEKVTVNLTTSKAGKTKKTQLTREFAWDESLRG